MDDTPLGRIVAIRSETDAKVIKDFTPEQKEIRNKWLARNRTETESAESYKNNMDMLFRAALA